MSKRSGSSNRRSSWFAAPTTNSMALPAGTVRPCTSTSARHVAADLRAGRLVPHQLFDRVRYQRPIVDELAPLVGMLARGACPPTRSGAWSSRCRPRRPPSCRAAPRRESACAWCRSRPRTRCAAARSSGRRRGARRASRCSRRTSRCRTSCSSATSIGWPASVRSVVSTPSRIASWSASGMPNSMPITRIGICAPKSAMRSNSSRPTRGSRLRAQNSRIFGSSAATRRGVNTRESRLRCTVCAADPRRSAFPAASRCSP